MSTTSKVTDPSPEKQAEQEAEELRWSRYRAEASPPRWLYILGLFGMLALTAYTLWYPDGVHSGSDVFFVVFMVVLYFSWRRNRAILQVIKEEDPELYEKMWHSGILDHERLNNFDILNLWKERRRKVKPL